MAGAQWIDFPLNTKVFENVPPEAALRAHAALENGFVTEAGGISRFPGLSEFVSLGGRPRVYLAEHDFRGDMIAATETGRVYRINKAGQAQDVTGTPITGGKRVIFSETTDQVLMAAGGPVIQFNGVTTKPLADSAPIATHVAYLDGYAVANEKDSPFWQHSSPGAFSSWDPLDIFSASGFPDRANSMIVTPYGELLIGGPQSIEQYERLPSGDPPFFRRWFNGEGIFAPYTLGFADNAVYFINSDKELIRLSGQTGAPLSDDIGRKLETIPDEDWTDAWATEVRVLGQKFILLAMPNALNPYGSRGLVYLYDYRQQKWCSLYGWDAAAGRPARWPGWSVSQIWGRRFVGGEGRIYELTTDTYHHAGTVARMLLRTAHLSELGEIRIDALRARIKRGTGNYSDAAQISIRANPDNLGFGKWSRQSFGRRGQRDMHVEFGNFGFGTSWQLEIEVTDDTPAELVKLQAQITQTGF